jgi:uncharacterized OB-fold protein
VQREQVQQYTFLRKLNELILSDPRDPKQIMNSRSRFIEAASRGKILANKCAKCSHITLETTYFCEKCSSAIFTTEEYDGVGNVVTFTIQSVAPEGFTDAGLYAWVVFRVDGAPLKVSGFLKDIRAPSDLPIGSKVQVAGFDEKHGLLLKRV